MENLCCSILYLYTLLTIIDTTNINTIRVQVISSTCKRYNEDSECSKYNLQICHTRYFCPQTMLFNPKGCFVYATDTVLKAVKGSMQHFQPPNEKIREMRGFFIVVMNRGIDGQPSADFVATSCENSRTDTTNGIKITTTNVQNGQPSYHTFNFTLTIEMDCAISSCYGQECEICVTTEQTTAYTSADTLQTNITVSDDQTTHYSQKVETGNSVSTQQVKTSNILPTQRVKTSSILATQRDKTSNILTTQGVTTSNILPTQRDKTSNILPTQGVTTSNILPTQRDKTSNILPTQRVKTSNILPTQRVKTSSILPTRGIKPSNILPTKGVTTSTILPTQRVVTSSEASTPRTTSTLTIFGATNTNTTRVYVISSTCKMYNEDSDCSKYYLQICHDTRYFCPQTMSFNPKECFVYAIDTVLKADKGSMQHFQPPNEKVQEMRGFFIAVVNRGSYGQSSAEFVATSCENSRTDTTNGIKITTTNVQNGQPSYQTFNFELTIEMDCAISSCYGQECEICGTTHADTFQTNTATSNDQTIKRMDTIILLFFLLLFNKL